MSQPIPYPSEPFTIDGRTFRIVAGHVIESAAKAELGAAAFQGGEVTLVVGSVIVALPGKEVSHEEARALGAAELAKYGTKANMLAHGMTPSPFQSEQLLQSLRTEAQIAAAPLPAHPTVMPGAAPATIASPPATPADTTHQYPQYTAPIDALRPPDGTRSPAGAPPAIGIPGMPLPGTLDQRKYDAVDSRTKSDESQAALGRLNDCFPNSKNITGLSDKAFRELKSELVGLEKGFHADHIVTQAQTERFGTQVIQHPGNIIIEPGSLHMERTAIGNRGVIPGSDEAEQGFRLQREATGALSHVEQLRVGIAEIRQAMDTLKVSPEVRDSVERQLRNVERRMPEVCAPGASRPKAQLPDPADLQPAVDKNNRTSARPLPPVQSVAFWNGRESNGTFVDLGDGTVAQHAGQGAYLIADIDNHLRGISPPFGQNVTLRSDGTVEPRMPGHQLGHGRSA